jgi:acyl carrier protein
MDYKDIALDVLAQVSGVDKSTIQPEMELVAHLSLDSAKALELLVELEEQLSIEIGDEDAARLNTVADIYAYLERIAAAA